MRKSLRTFWVLASVVCGLHGAPVRATSAPRALSVSGELFNSAGAPITQTSVNFKLLVYDAADQCVIYSEEHLAEDLSQTSGRFSLYLGGGSSIVNNVSSVHGLDEKVFVNAGSTVVANCSSSPIVMNGGDERHIRILYDLGTGYVAMTPAVPIVSSAYALVAETLAGLKPADLLQVNTSGSSALTQVNTEYAFSGVNWPRLKALLDGTSGQYLGTTPTAPVDIHGQKIVNVADPVGAQDVATKHYVDGNVGGSPLDLTAVGPMVGDGSTLKWDATANKWVAGILSTVPTGSAGGDLAGTYPNPSLKNEAVTANKVSLTGGGINRLLITDATTGAAIGFGTCALNQVYAWTATGFACTSVSALSPVTSVAGKTGAVVLNAADIAGLGTAAVHDVGSAANQIPLLGAGGTLPAVDGSNLTNVNATKLQSRAVASVQPTAGQVLGWNASASQWEPVAGAVATTVNIATTNGILGGPITSTGTLSVDTGTSASKILQLNAGAQIPAVDGSLLTQVNAVKLQTRAVSAALPGAGQVLGWNTSLSQWEPIFAATGSVVNIASGNGLLGGPISQSGTLSVDVGTAASKILQLNAGAQIPAVDGSLLSFVNAVKLQARTVSMALPGPGQVLGWNTSLSQWEPLSTSTGTVTTVASGVGLTGGPINTNGTLNVDVGTTASKILQLNAGAQIPVVDGSLLTQINAVKLQTRSVAATQPVAGQVLGWNVGLSQWEPVAGTAGAVTNVATANGILGGPITSTGTISVDTGTSASKILQLNAGAQIPAVDGSLLTLVNAVKLQARTVAATQPVAGQVLGWNVGLSQWEPVSGTAGAVTNVATSTGLLGGPITSNGTLSVDVGSAANQIVQENANAQIAQTSGTVALPSYTFAGNTNTGLYSPGANQLSLTTNGTAAINVAASGFVGIGTANARASLDVTGGVRFGNLMTNTSSPQVALAYPWEAMGPALNGYNLRLESPGGIFFHTNMTASEPNDNSKVKFYIGQNGSVGVNTTSGISTFDVAGSVAIGAYGGVSQAPPNGMIVSGKVGIGTNAPQAGLDVATTGTAGSAMIVPRDTTANRPTGVNGMLRYNNTLNAMEGFIGGIWSTLSSGTSAGTVTNVAGGTGILGGPITSSGTLSVDVGSSANKIVQENVNAQIAQTLGSAALPSYSFAGNTGTGVFSPGTNQLSLAANGTASLNILASGNVAIGTSTAAQMLEVAGVAKAYNFQAGYGSAAGPALSAGGNTGLYFTNSGNNLTFATVGLDRVTIDSSGNVGIGTVTPQSALDVAVTGTASALIVPRDTTANRPTGVNGMLRYNNSLNVLEGYIAGAWSALSSGSSAGTVTNVATSTGLLGGPITSNGTLSVDVGTTASKIVQLNANAQIAQPAGSGSAPAYTFVGSTDTGMYLPSTGMLSFSAAGTSALSIFPNGTVATASDISSYEHFDQDLSITAQNPFANRAVLFHAVAQSNNVGTLLNGTSGGISTGWFAGLNGSTNYVIGSGGRAPVSIESAAPDYTLYVNGTGRVGVNTTAPQAGLDVNTSGSASALLIPRDTTANRPTGVNGMLRYNNTSNVMEGFINGVWSALSSGTSAGTVTNVATSTGLLGGPITSNGTLSVDVGSGASKIVQENANAQIAQTAGTVALPSFSFAGNTKTGIYSPAINQLSLVTNGTSAVNVSAAGYLGVGTASPQGKLDMYQNDGQDMQMVATNLSSGKATYFNILSSSGFVSYGLSGVNNSWAMGENGSNNFSITDGTNSKVPFVIEPLAQNDAIHVAPAGRVGFGTATPSAALDIYSTGSSSAIIVPRDTTANRPTGVNGMLRYNNTLNAMEGFINGVWSTLSSGSSAGTVTNVATSTGLLGGPITTNGTLSVDVGSAANKIVQENANAQIAQTLGTVALPSYSFAGDADTGIFSAGADQLSLATNGTARLNVDAAGNVGIGTSSTTKLLQVGGSGGGAFAWDGPVNSGGDGLMTLTYAGGERIAFATNAGNYWAGMPGSTGGIRFNGGAGGYIVGGPTNSLLLNPFGGNVGMGTMTPQAALDVATTGTTSAIIVPRDTTANRPTGVNGMLRYNSTLNAMEGFINGVWSTLSSGSSAGTVTNVATSTGLLGGPITTNGTLSVDVGSAANKIVQENVNGQIAQMLGTAALPAYSFAGNVNTGLFSPSANQLSLVSNGTSALTVVSGGSVGIGTASPTAQVDVYNANLANVIVRTNATTAGANINLISNESAGTNASNMNVGVGAASVGGIGYVSMFTDKPIDLATQNTTRVRIASGSNGGGVAVGSYATNNIPPTAGLIVSGNVGVGTATPAAVLDVYGTGSVSAMVIPRDTTANRPTGVNGMLRYNNTLNAMEGFINGVWSTLSSGSSAGTVTNVATSTGLLGGPITTNGTLSVDVGSAANKIVQENNNAQIAQTAGSASLPTYTFANGANSGLYSPGANQVSLTTNGTAALTVINGGNVGIGTATPASKLYVYAPSGTDVATFAGPNGISTFDQYGSLKMGSGMSLANYDSNVAAAALTTYTGNLYLTSDGGGGGTNHHVILKPQGSGMVGVGTVTPQAMLDVFGTGSTSAMLVPRDTTANRPTGVNGMLRYNNTSNAMEGFINGVWSTLSSGSSAGTVTNVATSTGLLGGPITTNGTLSVDVGSAASKIVQENVNAQIAQMLGTVALPSYSFAGNAATGMYSPAANQLALVTNGTAALNVIENGNVGIGTTAPTMNLSLGGSGANRTIGMEPAASGSGFGLTLKAGGAASGATNGNGGLLTLSGGDTTGYGGSQINFNTTSSSQPGGTAAHPATTRMVLDSGGRLGVNEPYPTFMLEVGGGGSSQARFKNSNLYAVGNEGGISFGNQNSSYSTTSFGEIRGGTTTATAGSEDGYLKFLNVRAGTMTEAMRITSAGNVAIGTTLPLAGLDIATTGTGGSAVVVPRDTTANRPSSPANGMLRYNTTSSKFEAYENGAWANLIGTGGSLTFPILAPNGSNTAPVYSFSASNTTGVYSPNPNQLGLSANGVLGILVDDSGNVGIGTNAATATVDINKQTLLIRGNASSAGELRLQPGPNIGTNYVGFQGPVTNPSTSVLWRLPAADGTAGQVLTTNGTAALSWTTPATGGGSTINCGDYSTNQARLISSSSNYWAPFCLIGQSTSFQNTNWIGRTATNYGAAVLSCANDGADLCSAADVKKAYGANTSALNGVQMWTSTMGYVSQTQNPITCSSGNCQPQEWQPYVFNNGSLSNGHTDLGQQQYQFFCCRH